MGQAFPIETKTDFEFCEYLGGLCAETEFQMLANRLQLGFNDPLVSLGTRLALGLSVIMGVLRDMPTDQARSEILAEVGARLTAALAHQASPDSAGYHMLLIGDPIQARFI